MILKVADLAERRKTAEAAKALLLDRFRARPPADDPEVVARAAERLAVAQAREARIAERERAAQARREEIEAARAARQRAREEAEAEAAAAAQAEVMARQKADLDRAGRVMADESARKAQRDARYAARKARVGR